MYKRQQVASVYGIIAACLLVGLLAVFLFCLFRMIYKQKNRLGKIVGYGCLMVIAAEIAGNLMINFGFYTISTGGLPFFSYGGYHTVTIYVLLGVIFSIHRYQLSLIHIYPQKSSAQISGFSINNTGGELHSRLYYNIFPEQKSQVILAA